VIIPPKELSMVEQLAAQAGKLKTAPKPILKQSTKTTNLGEKGVQPQTLKESNTDSRRKTVVGI
jgi:hypothetical protein